MLTLFLLGVAIASQPASFAALHQPCTAGAVECNGQGLLTASQIQVLHGLGLSLDTYAWSRIVTTGLGALLLFVMGGILFWRRSDDWMVLLVALLFASLGATNATDVLEFGSPFWRMLEQSVLLIESLALLLTLALFPNGRFVPRWTLWIVLLYPAYVVFYLVLLNQLHLLGWTLFNNPVNAVLWFGCWGILTLAQLYRYFRVSTPVEQQQTKWVAFTFFVVLVVGIVGWVTTPTLLSLLHTGFLYLLTTNLAPFIGLFFPLSIGIAILRYRLWDIDFIINRTLVYGTLTASVIGLYLLLVVSLGTLLQARGNFLISLVSTGVIAVLFQPLRIRLQRGVNRLMFGERDNPYTVISRLGQRLEATLMPEAVLPTIVETVALALKLPYVAITLKRQGELVPEASYGSPMEQLTRLPLVYQNEQVGELLLAPRTPGESFTSADRRLLDDLARQAGVAVHAVRLTQELKRLTQDLQHARERLISAREEERRRLRRDLHDGLGPQLSSQTLLLTSVQMLLRQDPDEAEAILKSAIAQSQEAISDIRRLVYALRPPALDDLGLIAAIEEQLTQNRASGIAFSFDAPEQLSPLPAAVEVACYRIVQEAITNVVRHAYARNCIVHLKCEEQLTIEVIDDGQGLPPAYRCGVGLTSMRERAEELGGSWLIEPVSGQGTRVQACIPYR